MLDAALCHPRPDGVLGVVIKRVAEASRLAWYRSRLMLRLRQTHLVRVNLSHACQRSVTPRGACGETSATPVLCRVHVRDACAGVGTHLAVIFNRHGRSIYCEKCKGLCGHVEMVRTAVCRGTHLDSDLLRPSRTYYKTWTRKLQWYQDYPFSVEFLQRS